MPTQSYDWIIRFILNIITFFIILFLLRPLWKLTSTRTALIIVFSRAVGNVLKLLFDILVYLHIYILKNEISESYTFISSASGRILYTMQATHILALATNLVHAIFFPFHYRWFAAKRK